MTSTAARHLFANQQGSIDAERFFAALKDFVAGLDQEEQRAAREALSEEELTIFDLLTTPEPKLSKAQEVEVKAVARRLLEKLHELIHAVPRYWEDHSGYQWYAGI